MVPLLDRMLCAEIQASVPVSIACFTVLLAVNYLFALARVFVDFGLPVHDALLLTLYKVPYFAAFSVPIGVFLATVLGIGRLADRNEIAALRVVGASVRRIATPIVLVGALAALGTLAFSESIVSLSEHAYRSVMQHVLSHTPRLQPVARQFVRLATPEGAAFYSAGRYHPETRLMDGATVLFLTRGRPPAIIQAQDARLDPDAGWAFHRGRMDLLLAGSVDTTRFATLHVTWPPVAGPSGLAAEAPSQMSLRELAARIADLRRRGADARPYWSELHMKLSTAASCIIFALIALPLSLRHRSGVSTGFGLSLLVVAAYYAVAIPAQLASDARLLAPAVAAWLPDLTLGAAGTWLLLRTR